jgi:hypothetical protein
MEGVMRNPAIVLLSVICVVTMMVCSGGSSGEQESTNATESPDHDHDHEHAAGGHTHELAPTATYDIIRDGIRLIMAYDADTGSFKGSVENTTEGSLYHVKVHVHLSNGDEIAPFDLGDLTPGEKRDVEMKATGTEFDSWSVHPEVGHGEGFHNH